ncbi:MAG: acyl carrier protein [Acidimicrobiia bacterium]
MNHVEAQIRRFILDELGWPGDACELDRATPVLDGDVIDSMGIYELATFLEQQYGIEILDEEVVPEHFGSIAALARLVDAKR